MECQSNTRLSNLQNKKQVTVQDAIPIPPSALRRQINSREILFLSFLALAGLLFLAEDLKGVAGTELNLVTGFPGLGSGGSPFGF
jgi:hypothetical protein